MFIPILRLIKALEPSEVEYAVKGEPLVRYIWLAIDSKKSKTTGKLIMLQKIHLYLTIISCKYKNLDFANFLLTNEIKAFLIMC